MQKYISMRLKTMQNNICLLFKSLKLDYFQNLEKAKGKDELDFKTWFKMNFYYKLPMGLRAHIYYLYRYYIKLGFLDGKEGKIYAFLQAYWYRYLVDAKIYESKKMGTRYKGIGELK